VVERRRGIDEAAEAGAEASGREGAPRVEGPPDA
jgi:hypothetical protein